MRFLYIMDDVTTKLTMTGLSRLSAIKWAKKNKNI